MVSSSWTWGEETFSQPENQQALANARLIAAAPALLEACQSALIGGVNTPTYPDGPCLDKDVRDEIAAAVALATGRTQCNMNNSTDLRPSANPANGEAATVQGQATVKVGDRLVPEQGWDNEGRIHVVTKLHATGYDFNIYKEVLIGSGYSPYSEPGSASPSPKSKAPNNDEHQEDYKAAIEGEIGADRMALGLACIPDKIKGDLDKYKALSAAVTELVEAAQAVIPILGSLCVSSADNELRRLRTKRYEALRSALEVVKSHSD